MTTFSCKILPGSDHPTVILELERSVIDVLTDVVLIQPHTSVWRERHVLCVDDIDLQLDVIRVFEIDMPEPTRLLMRELQCNRVADALPHPDAYPSILRDPPTSCARGRTQQTRELHSTVRRVNAQIK